MTKTISRHQNRCRLIFCQLYIWLIDYCWSFKQTELTEQTGLRSLRSIVNAKVNKKAWIESVGFKEHGVGIRQSTTVYKWHLCDQYNVNYNLLKVFVMCVLRGRRRSADRPHEGDKASALWVQFHRHHDPGGDWRAGRSRRHRLNNDHGKRR